MRISSSRFDSRGRGRGRGFGSRNVRQSPLLNSRTRDYPSGFKDESKFARRSRSRSPQYGHLPFIKKDEFPRSSSWSRRNAEEPFMNYESRGLKVDDRSLKIEKHHDLKKPRVKKSLPWERRDSPERRSHSRPVAIGKDPPYHSRPLVRKANRSWSRSPPPPPKYSKSHSNIRNDYKSHKHVHSSEDLSSHRRPVFHGPEGSIIDESELKKITININRHMPRHSSPGFSSSSRYSHGESTVPRRSEYFAKVRSSGSDSHRSYDYYPSKDDMFVKSSHPTSHSSHFGRPVSGHKDWHREPTFGDKDVGHSSRSRRSSSFEKDARSRDLRDRINEKRYDFHDDIDPRSKLTRKRGFGDDRYGGSSSQHHEDSSKPMYTSRKIRDDDRYSSLSSMNDRSYNRSLDRSFDHTSSRDWSQDDSGKKYSSGENEGRRESTGSRGFRGSGLKRRRPRRGRPLRGSGTRGRVFKRSSPSRRSKELTPDF